MKINLFLILNLILAQNLSSQELIFEKYYQIDLMEFDDILGVPPRLIEITDDNLLLIGGYLSEFYLYDLKHKKLIKKQKFENDWNTPSDIIKTKNGNFFIINYDWGILILDKELNIENRFEIESSQLMEIKLSEKGTLFQRTETEIREIDIDKMKVLNSFNFEEQGYDLELNNNEDILLTNGKSEIVVAKQNGEIINKIKLRNEEEIFEGVFYMDKYIYTPITFENKVAITNLENSNTIELDVELPTKIIKLSSNELIVGNGHGKVLIFKENQLIQTITHESAKYSPQNPFINHIETDSKENYLIFTGEGSSRIFIYQRKK